MWHKVVSPAALLFLVLLHSTTCEGTEYFVSLSGDDSNPGSMDKPWRHVQEAVSKLQPGDTCTIKEGRYSEEVVINGLQGSQEKPITFRSSPGDNVVFDGTAIITSSWTKYKGSIYKTELKEDIWQLFVDGEMQVNARWPNAFWDDFSVFNYTLMAKSSENSTYNATTGTGVMVDNGKQDLAGSGLNATGAIAILNIGSWMTWPGHVESHKPGERNFTYMLKSPPSVVSFNGQFSRYFLEDKLEFLDAPTEWFYDMASSMLYLWTKKGDSPENYEIRGKVSTYALTVTNTSAYIVFSQLNFFATTVYIHGNNRNDAVHNIKLDSLHFSYPSYTKRMLGSLAPPNTTTIYYSGLLTKEAGNFTIFNCTWEYADGQTINYRGADGTIENNLWRYNDFSCVGDGKLFQSYGIRDRFVRNEFHGNGPSEGYCPGNGALGKVDPTVPSSSIVRLNLMYDEKSLQNDGSLVQTGRTAQNGTVVEFNWGFSTQKWGVRFDCTDFNVTRSSCGSNGTIRHNVIWNTRGVSVKGDYHTVENNLIFKSLLYHDLFLRGYRGTTDSFKGENTHSSSTGNVLEHDACSVKSKTKCESPIPGNFTNNVMMKDVGHYLRDPANLDFRPKHGSDLVAKGIGPYGKEAMSHGGTYWIPGRQLRVASNPIPPNSTSTAKCDADLMWLAGYNARAHDVYFGTNKTEVLTADHSSAAYKGEMKMPANVQTPGTLKPDTAYYWRVDAITDMHHNTGELWWFNCKI